MAIKLNESVLQMKLNADNRNKFQEVILKDVFLKRSNELRERMYALQDKIIDETWGNTPQSRKANKQKQEAIVKDLEKLKAKGFQTSDVPVGNVGTSVRLNLAGQSKYYYFNSYKYWLDENFKGTLVNISSEFFVHKYGSSEGALKVALGRDTLNMTQDSPIYKEICAIEDEARDLKDAHEEFMSILNTVFGKSRTLKAAMDTWPALGEYTPQILSACREITVRAPELDAKIKALREGKLPVKKAMKVGQKDAD